MGVSCQEYGRFSVTGIVPFRVKPKRDDQCPIFGKDTIADYRYTRAQVGISSQEFTQDWFFPLDRLLYFQAGYYGIPKAQAKNRIDE